MARTTGSHSDITGPRIVAAAQHLIAKHGFAAVSMRQIAREVGVQAGALYNYFPDKQSMLKELMLAHLQDLLADVQALSLQDPLTDLETFVRFHIAQNRGRADAVFIAYMELRNLTDENFAEVEALRRDYERFLEGILAKGAAQGQFTLDNPRITARALIAMLNGVNTWFREGGALSLSEVQDLYWTLARQTVGAT